MIDAKVAISLSNERHQSKQKSARDSSYQALGHGSHAIAEGIQRDIKSLHQTGIPTAGEISDEASKSEMSNFQK